MTGFLRVAVLFITFAGCSSTEATDNDKCPIDTTVLSLEDSEMVVGTWKRLAGRTLQCSEEALSEPSLRIMISRDSVFIIEGFYDNSGIRAFELLQREGTLGNPFLQFDFHLLYLTPGDTLILDSTYLDGGQIFFMRE